MEINNTEITKRQVAGILNSLQFDPKDTGSRENVAARCGADYCCNRAIEELVAVPDKKLGARNAVKLLVLAIAKMEAE